MTVDISQGAHYLLTKAVSALRDEYEGVRSTINAEATTGAYSCPELLPENVKFTAYPNPPGGGSSWVGMMVMGQAEQAGLALTQGRTIFDLRVQCGVRYTSLVAGDVDLTGQDTGWHTSSLMGAAVRTVLVRHLTDFSGIYICKMRTMRALPGDTTGGRDTFVQELLFDVHMITYDPALTT